MGERSLTRSQKHLFRKIQITSVDRGRGRLREPPTKIICHYKGEIWYFEKWWHKRSVRLREEVAYMIREMVVYDRWSAHRVVDVPRCWQGEE